MAKKEPKKEQKEPGLHKAYRMRLLMDIGYRYPGKKMNQESQTVPDLSLTVRQLVENHTRGKDSNVEVKQPLYFDVAIPTVTDITDVERYRDQLQEALDQTNDFIKEDLKRGEEQRKKDAENGPIRKDELHREIQEVQSNNPIDSRPEPDVDTDGQIRIPDA